MNWHTDWETDSIKTKINQLNAQYIVYYNQLAIFFFNRLAAMNPDYIAFIIPASFNRLVHKLDKFYHVISESYFRDDYVLPDGSLFKNLWSAFIVYERRDILRTDIFF